MSFRTIIKSELKKRGWSGYRLSQETGDRVTKRVVQKYLPGESAINVESFELLCRALGLELRSVQKRKRR